MHALQLRGIEKTYPGGHVAVAGVDLEVAQGEMVILLGPSGCGKSTLLRIVAGIESPTAGDVFVNGVEVTEQPPQKRDIAMVFQNYALYPHMSVRQNLAFGLKMRGLARPAASQRVAEVAESLGITALLDRRPSQLSGGQRQRVALGRAIARKAKVFLLDEPLSNLDVQLRVHTRTELARLHRSLDVPMLYVTHDQEEAMTLGDRVAVMCAGRLLQVGPPMEIYARPASQFVGGFVGSPRMNFFPGKLVPQSPGGARVEALGAVVQIEPKARTRPGAGATSASSGVDREPRPVVVGIRPEHLEIVSPADADLLAVADVVEPLGREILVHLVTDGPRGSARAPRGDAGVELRALAGAGAAVQPGARVGLRLRRDSLHLFDPSTEVRLPDLG